jgi:hypothetical protein
VKVKAHPERRAEESKWDEHDRGIFLADCVADPDEVKQQQGASLAGAWSNSLDMVISHLPVDKILEWCIARSRYYIRDMDSGTILLTDLLDKEAQRILPRYVRQRDVYRQQAVPPRPPQWVDMTSVLAEAAWRCRAPKGQGKMTMSKRGAVVRGIWSKWMFGDKRRSYGEDVHSKCRRCMASESYEHILSHCEHEDNKAYRNLTLATAKEIRESMEKEPKDQAVHGVMVALDKVFHSQFRASPLAWTGMLTQDDVEMLGDAVLATPLSDQQMTSIAKYVRAYTDGALALMSGYIHSILPPHPTTKNKSDIRHFFPRKIVTAPNPIPTPTAEEWQPARHGVKRSVEPTQQSPPAPTNNPFGPLDDDDEAHSEDATSVSIQFSPVLPKRAKVLKRLIKNNQHRITYNYTVHKLCTQLGTASVHNLCTQLSTQLVYTTCPYEMMRCVHKLR